MPCILSFNGGGGALQKQLKSAVIDTHHKDLHGTEIFLRFIQSK